MASRRQPLTAPKPPKGGDIDAMLKFIHEQQQKPSDAAAVAKRLKKVSNQSKQREQFQNQSKSFMTELRKLVKLADSSQHLATQSLIDLSTVPELPSLLKLDANLMESRQSDFDKCQDYKDRLESICTRSRTPQINSMFNGVMQEFKSHLEVLEFPDSYEDVVDLVEKTKLAPPPSKANSYDFSELPMEWQEKGQELISVFAQVEKELTDSYVSWLKENNFDPSQPCGGWDEFEHQRFILSGDHFSVEFPEKSKEELLRHKKWYIRTQFLNKKRDALRAELHKRIMELCEDAKRDQKEKEEKAELDRIAEERRKELSDEKAELNQRLKVERAEKKKKDELKRQQEEEEQRVRMMEEQHQKQIQDAQNKKLKQKVQSEKEKRSQKEQHQLEIRRRQEEQEKIIQKQRMKAAKQTVEGRQAMYQQKKMQRIEKDAEKAEREVEKKKRLDVLAQQVRDEFGLDNLKAEDPARLTLIQKMRRNAEKEERPMYVQNSFSSAQIEADPRIRVENALREAGLMGSEYVHQLMQQMSAARVNPGMQSNFNFS